jgi:uncharacterized protein
MLIEFSVANYRSFKDRVTFSMVAAPIKSKDKRLDENNVFAARPKLSLLTSAAIYGANASGKSNLISAMHFVRQFVLARKKETRRTGGVDVEPFRLNTDTHDKPSEFEIVFIAEGRQYRYGFRTDRERVHAEWLYHVPTTREALLFERTGDDVALAAGFREGKGLQAKTRPNALFLSVVAEFNGQTAQRIIEWFGDAFHVISGLEDAGLMPFTVECLGKAEYREAVTELIRRLDVGINTVDVETSEVDLRALPDDVPEEVRTTIELLAKQRPEGTSEDSMKIKMAEVRTGHDLFDSQGLPSGHELFDLELNESEGTQRIFALAGPLVDTLRNGKIVVADEFDARLHPMLTRELMRLFNSAETNPRHAQLVIATHDTNLLDHRLLRRDQIWFTEKNRFGATDLYSLAEYKGVRNDASYEKDYVHGRYGAIPYLGDLAGLLGGGDAAQAS